MKLSVLLDIFSDKILIFIIFPFKNVPVRIDKVYFYYFIYLILSIVHFRMFINPKEDDRQRPSATYPLYFFV